MAESLLKPPSVRRSLVETGRFAEKRDGGWKNRLIFMCCGDQHRSHLEHLTDHDEFTKNGVHYVSWLDVVFNVSGRPSMGWKMLLIIACACVETDIVVNDRTNTFLDDGVGKDTISYLTFGLALLLVFRVGQSYGRYNDARVKWGMMVNRTRDLSRQFFCYCSDNELNVRANRWIIAYVYGASLALSTLVSASMTHRTQPSRHHRTDRTARPTPTPNPPFAACKQSLRWKSSCVELKHTLREEEVRRRAH